MEKLREMKDTLVSCVEKQLYGNMQNVNAKELGEAVDMIKDLEEAMYYCSITEAMDEKKRMIEHEKYCYPQIENRNRQQYILGYHESPELMNSSRPIYNDNRRDSISHRGFSDGKMYYEMDPYMSREDSYPREVRDFREGRSPLMRRNYMESKELHQDKEKQIKELEKYMKELCEDVTEMVEGASQEEKMMLSQKLNTLAEKIEK